MARTRTMKKEIIALCGSLVVVLIGAIPLFDKHNDAQILAIFFGAFAAGASCCNLIIKVRDKKEEAKAKSEVSS